MNLVVFSAAMGALLMACGSPVDDSGDCLPQCPESENSPLLSDIPCGTDDGDDGTIEASCVEVAQCGEVFYCRMTGF